MCMRSAATTTRSWSRYACTAAGTLPFAKLCQRFLFPRLGLAAVDGEFGDGGGSLGGGFEAAAGVDLGELVVVADEDDSAAGVGDVCRESFEEADVGHAGFVDDEHGRGVDGEVVSLDRREERVHGAGRDVRPAGEFDRGAGRGSGADHGVAGGFVGVADGVERVGLAAAGWADEHGDRSGRGADRSDGGRLVVADARACGDRLVDCLRREPLRVSRRRVSVSRSRCSTATISRLV